MLSNCALCKFRTDQSPPVCILLQRQMAAEAHERNYSYIMVNKWTMMAKIARKSTNHKKSFLGPQIEKISHDYKQNTPTNNGQIIPKIAIIGPKMV